MTNSDHCTFDGSIQRERQIDALCDEFEVHCVKGERPDIESYLARVEDGHKQTLLIELIAIEMHYRRKQGESAALSEYELRFPDYSIRQNMSADATVTSRASLATNRDIDLSYLSPSTQPGSLGTLAHYEILEVLGQGGFGTVLKGFDDKLQRLVAIKVLGRELAKTSPPRKRFLREARSVAAIKNENVIGIYSVEEQPLPFIVMEFVDGLTLQEKMDLTGPISVAETLVIGKQIASGLAAAHALGIIHRDIKPANILLENGVVQRVKITDFGLARTADDASMTQSGMIVGTPLYMAPEQAHGAKIDARTDLFSLGSVLYALTTGHPPFRAHSAFAVLRRVTQDTPRPIREVIADIPDWLIAIIDKLLAKEPERRFQSAQELVDLLAKCQSELQAGVPVTAAKPLEVATRKTSHPRPSESTKTNKYLVVKSMIGLALLAVVLAVGLYSVKPKIQREADVVARDTTALAPSITGSADSSRPTTIQKQPQEVPRHFGNDGIDAPQVNNNSPSSPPSTIKNSLGMEFVKVPRGSTWLGGRAGQPGSRKVDIQQDFYVGKYEVTQAEWEAVLGLKPSYFARQGKGADAVKDISEEDLKRFPVEQISWDDCHLFIEHLNTMEKDTGRVYRLLKEAEWEYACRGGPGNKLDSAFDFYFNKSTNTMLPEHANFAFAGGLKRTTKVGSYSPNTLGLHDMHGNVWEWCEDVVENASGTVGREQRGGAWFNPAELCKAAVRNLSGPNSRYSGNGLRLALGPSGVSEPTEQDQKK